MFEVILDCDNTLGVSRSDIDDGLTFAYLYAHPDVHLLGVTCSFGNNAGHVVYANTVQMMEDLAIADVPVLRGGRRPGDWDTEAVEFLVKTVREHPGEITLIATGSLTNLAGALSRDPCFLDNLRQLIVMGGMLEPLKLHGRVIAELNFSVDFRASAMVLSHCPRLTILSAQCTQAAFFGDAELRQLLSQKTRFMQTFSQAIRDWVNWLAPFSGGHPGFVNWDLCCAIYLTHPELFRSRSMRIAISEDTLRTGWLREDRTGAVPEERISVINIPSEILDLDAFNREFYRTLARIG